MTKLRAASMFVFVSLLALVFAIGMAVAYKIGLPSQFVMPFCIGFALLIVGVQYAVGPVLLDWILKVRWVSPMELGPDFALWQRQTCQTFRIAEPRIGIIEDGKPNAFTYGHGPWDGRVIISRGLIDILDPEELQAVYGHELGHIKNRDFIMMTLIQALVLVLYVFARTSRFGNNKNTAVVILVSWVAYWVSYYVSLLFSRLREYLADYASAQILRNPNALCTALVKVSYGLAQTRPAQPNPYGVAYPGRPQTNAPLQPQFGGVFASGPTPNLGGAYSAPATQFSTAQQPDKAMLIAQSFQKPADPKVAAKQQKERESTLQALGAFGIANAASMRAAVSWYSPGSNLPDNFAQVARWEIYNPWAKIAEVLSTHPLTAHRIMALQKLNSRFGQKDVFDFKKVQPAKYTKFVRDLFVVSLPAIGLGAGLLASAFVFPRSSDMQRIAFVLIGLIAGALGRLITEYAVSSSGRSKVLQLLSQVNVSHVNPQYVEVDGILTGRLQAGFMWAKDFIAQDDTGYIACIYRQPFGFWEFLFGWLTAPTLIGRAVKIRGWYRRFNAPFLEIDTIQMLDNGETRKAYHFPYLVAVYLVFLILAGLLTTVH
jgi:Zn-dependent protease with chaperone function